MQTVNLDIEGAPIKFQQARRRAAGKAGETLRQPVVIAWKDENSGVSAPEIPGASNERWRDYASSNGGRLAVKVGDTFQFVFSEAADFEEPDLNVGTLTEEDGTSILCTKGACTEEERQKLGYFAGGGIGG